MPELQKKFYTLLMNEPQLVIDGEVIELLYSPATVASLQEMHIHPEIIRDARIRIVKHELPFTFFSHPDEFYLSESLPDDPNLLIFDRDLPVSYVDGKTYLGFEERSDCFIVANAISFLQFLAFLRDRESYTDGTFNFIDYYSKDHKRIVLTSLTEKGRIILTYGPGTPRLDNSIDYSAGLINFRKCFQADNERFLIFLKSSIIEFASGVDPHKRFTAVFVSLDTIIAKAKVNFEVYLNNLSIDKFKHDYDEVKSKYFTELSGILSTLTQKILGLPVGLAATLFALENVKNNDFFLYVLIALLFVTSGYLNILLKINFKDLINLDKQFKTEYGNLMGNPFFTNCPEQRVFFEEMKDRFYDRLIFLKRITDSYYIVLNLCNVLLFSYILFLLNLRSSAILIVDLGLLLLVAVVRTYLLQENRD
jgi:hypothetical protein